MRYWNSDTYCEPNTRSFLSEAYAYELNISLATELVIK